MALRFKVSGALTLVSFNPCRAIHHPNAQWLSNSCLLLKFMCLWIS